MSLPTSSRQTRKRPWRKPRHRDAADKTDGRRFGLVRRPGLLILSQVYVPDPASVGQHLHDAAVEMVQRGYSVRVITSARGYDAPEIRYPRLEMRDGVEIVRLPLGSFGKRSIPVRIVGQLLFLLQAIVRALLARDVGGILVSTSPPMCSAAALLVAMLRRVPMVYWVMDINPDQAVSLGAVGPRSPLVWLFERFNRLALGRANAVVTLDRFMAERLRKKRDMGDKLAVFPPWPHDDHLDAVAHEANPFRKEHRLKGKFVVMYSGNHSPANPITTVLRAAERLQDRDDLVFAFIGGGGCKREVAEAVAAGATNILDLPYQPIERLRFSLSAADVHLVSLGERGVGIVHPCKVYGAMSVGRPVLFLGPRPSHVAELIDDYQIGRQVAHGDVDGMVAAIEELVAMPTPLRDAMGARAKRAVRAELSKTALCRRLGDVVEAALGTDVPATLPIEPAAAPAPHFPTAHESPRREAA